MRLRPSHTFCGCATLLVGVEVICLLTLLTNISIIAAVTSSSTMKVSSFTLSSTTQIWLGTWAFIGIPVTIVAGVAALYRIEMPLRAMFFYLTASFFIYIGLPLYLLASGSLCDTVVTPEVQRMGSAFVCGFTDSLTFFWTLVLGTLDTYLLYIVWSAAEEIAEAPYPELMKYSEALKSINVPDAPQGYGYSMGNNRGAALMTQGPMSGEGMMGPSYGAFKPGMGSNPFGPASMPPTGMSVPGMPPTQAGGAQTQSFIPAPGGSF